ncbi:MAG: hypothetical protein RMY16_25295, partial [Nostoc sp. DedQUE12b]|uniref:hypothetical protein n=1 Tax=Nostoc sp. DedQUE12b TaxID=3075398 RepID=UPI002AD43C72
MAFVTFARCLMIALIEKHKSKTYLCFSKATERARGKRQKLTVTSPLLPCSPNTSRLKGKGEREKGKKKP